MHKMLRCPYCHRELQEIEKYCFFCELDLSKVWDKVEKERYKTEEPETTVLDDIKHMGKTLKKYGDALKKKTEELKKKTHEKQHKGSIFETLKKKIKKRK